MVQFPQMPGTDQEHPDRCFRCDYDLRGIVDDQPCPECGLLAERSRRKTEHLADAPPGWLRRVSVGLWIVLAALLVLPPWAVVHQHEIARSNSWRVRNVASGHGPLGVATVGALLLGTGVWLFTTTEPRITADRAARGRTWLRRSAFLPVAAMLIMHAWLLVLWTSPHLSYEDEWRMVQWQRLDTMRSLQGEQIVRALAIVISFLPLAAGISLVLLRKMPPSSILRLMPLYLIPTLLAIWFTKHVLFVSAWSLRTASTFSNMPTPEPPWFIIPQLILYRYGDWIAYCLLTVGLVALSTLLFFYLRWLASRALRVRLAEHCAIMAFGTAGLLLLWPATTLFFQLTDHILGEAWGRRGLGSSLVIATVISVALVIYGWMLLTLTRGALAFARAARDRRGRWATADRSVAA